MRLSGDVDPGVTSQVGLVLALEVFAPGVDVTSISFLIGLTIIIFTIL
jgi:hypothetical protein